MGKSKEFVKYRLKGVLLGLSFIIIFFYTYSGIIGKNFLILDILSFIISIIICEYITLKYILTFNQITSKEFIFSILIWCILLLCFIVFTFYPIHIGLFKDPITNGYGII